MPQLSSSREPAPGRITVDIDGGQRVLRMSGEIDAEVIAAFCDQQAATLASEGGPNVPLITAVDLADVTFMSSTGIGFLIRHTQVTRQAGQLPVLRGVARPARRVMDITGVIGLFRSAA